MNALGLGPAALAVVPLLVLGAAVACWLGRLHSWRTVPTAALRAPVQLGVVGLLISVVLRSTWLTVAFLLLMLGTAAFTSGRRIGGHLPRAMIRAGVAIGVPSAVVLGILLLSGATPNNPATLLPLGGILIGGAMSATSLAGRRILADLGSRWGEYEAALAIGLTPRQAIREVAGPAGGDTLVPALDQTRTVGLVTLPGTFVGMVLGGAAPARAAAFQLVVLVCLLVVEALAIVLVTELVAAAAPFERPVEQPNRGR